MGWDGWARLLFRWTGNDESWIVDLERKFERKFEGLGVRVM